VVHSLYNIDWNCFSQGGRRGKIAVIGLILLIIVTDQTGNRVLKELFERARPCYVLIDVITPVGCAGGFSFPSNHALNNFAAAVFSFEIISKLQMDFF